MIVGVPDSSIPMAIGYSLESGIPFTEGLCKNRYIGRTFIQPTDESRTTLASIKYNPLVDNLRDKNVVVVDDSLVRGHTVSQLIKLLKSANPKSLHVRIASPPLRFPCFMGVDMKTKEELIANHHSVDEICVLIGADSLAYLSHEGMVRAVSGVKGREAEIVNNDAPKESEAKAENGALKVDAPKVAKSDNGAEPNPPNADKNIPDNHKPPTKGDKNGSEGKVDKDEPPKADSDAPHPKAATDSPNVLAANSDINGAEAAITGHESASPSTKSTAEEKETQKSTPNQNTTESNSPTAKKQHNTGFCSACFTGEYPLDIEDIPHVFGLDT